MIEKEIDGLPEKMREVFILSRKYNLSHREIAEQLGIAESTVTKQVKNALKILRMRLDRLPVYDLVFALRLCSRDAPNDGYSCVLSLDLIDLRTPYFYLMVS